MSFSRITTTFIALLLTQCSCNYSKPYVFSFQDYIKYYFLASVHRHKLVDVNGLKCGEFDFYECTFEIDTTKSLKNSYVINIITPNGCRYVSDHGNYGIVYKNNYLNVLMAGRYLDSMIVYKEEINFLVKWKDHNIQIKDPTIAKIAAHRYQQIFGIFD